MDHVVYVDEKAEELPAILSGAKTMIIRGATGGKIPHRRVNPDDVLYLIENDGTGQIRAKAQVVSVFNSEKVTKDGSISLVEEHQDKLNLTSAQSQWWAGKRYLVLIVIRAAKKVKPFKIDRSGYGNMDDWLPVGNIGKVKAG